MNLKHITATLAVLGTASFMTACEDAQARAATEVEQQAGTTGGGGDDGSCGQGACGAEKEDQ